MRIAVAEGSSLIVQRNGPVQIARDAAARLIAFRKAAQCLHVALLRCARIKLRSTRPVLLHTVPGKVQVSEGALGLCILLLRRQRIQLDRPGHVPFQSDAVLIAESQLILCRRKAEGGTVPKQLSRSPLILLCSLADHIAGPKEAAACRILRRGPAEPVECGVRVFRDTVDPIKIVDAKLRDGGFIAVLRRLKAGIEPGLLLLREAHQLRRERYGRDVPFLILHGGSPPHSA